MQKNNKNQHIMTIASALIILLLLALQGTITKAIEETPTIITLPTNDQIKWDNTISGILKITPQKNYHVLLEPGTQYMEINERGIVVQPTPTLTNPPTPATPDAPNTLKGRIKIVPVASPTTDAVQATYHYSKGPITLNTILPQDGGIYVVSNRIGDAYATHICVIIDLRNSERKDQFTSISQGNNIQAAYTITEGGTTLATLGCSNNAEGSKNELKFQITNEHIQAYPTPTSTPTTTPTTASEQWLQKCEQTIQQTMPGNAQQAYLEVIVPIQKIFPITNEKIDLDKDHYGRESNKHPHDKVMFSISAMNNPAVLLENAAVQKLMLPGTKASMCGSRQISIANAQHTIIPKLEYSYDTQKGQFKIKIGGMYIKEEQFTNQIQLGNVNYFPYYRAAQTTTPPLPAYLFECENPRPVLKVVTPPSTPSTASTEPRAPEMPCTLGIQISDLPKNRPIQDLLIELHIFTDPGMNTIKTMYTIDKFEAPPTSPAALTRISANSMNDLLQQIPETGFQRLGFLIFTTPQQNAQFNLPINNIATTDQSTITEFSLILNYRETPGSNHPITKKEFDYSPERTLLEYTESMNRANAEYKITQKPGQTDAMLNMRAYARTMITPTTPAGSTPMHEQMHAYTLNIKYLGNSGPTIDIIKEERQNNNIIITQLQTNNQQAITPPYTAAKALIYDLSIQNPSNSNGELYITSRATTSGTTMPASIMLDTNGNFLSTQAPRPIIQMLRSCGSRNDYIIIASQEIKITTDSSDNTAQIEIAKNCEGQGAESKRLIKIHAGRINNNQWLKIIKGTEIRGQPVIAIQKNNQGRITRLINRISTQNRDAEARGIRVQILDQQGREITQTSSTDQNTYTQDTNNVNVANPPTHQERSTAQAPPIVDRTNNRIRNSARTTPITHIMLHHTAGVINAEAQITDWVRTGGGVGAHYIIEKSGRIVRVVPDNRRVGHAGVREYNSNSIGIEIINCGAGTPRRGCGQDNIHACGIDDYPQEQQNAVKALVAYLVTRYNIPSDHVIGHGMVTARRIICEPCGLNRNLLTEINGLNNYIILKDPSVEQRAPCKRQTPSMNRLRN